MAVFKRGKKWWYKFVWNGELIRESTKQTNKRVAEQMESAHKTALAKGEVGIRDKAPVPTLKDFAEQDFKPYIEARFPSKPKTLEYYRTGLKNLNGYVPLANAKLDEISAEKICGFVAKRREAGLEVSSINRQLEVLRRMLKLAMEWGKVEKVLPRVEMLPGEKHRDRVLTIAEESAYLEAATAIGEQILESYRRALEGIRATMRGEEPIRPEDPFLLRDVTTILTDCGLRPEECFRLRWEYVRDGAVHVPFGKTESARRTIPLTARAAAQLEMRRAVVKGEWVFPASTRSGHIEKSSLKKQHSKACKLAKVADFPLYTFRHTCLTRWAAYMDPYTLGYLAGHSDFSTTRRYVHPQAHTIMEAIERARKAQGGHRNGHNAEKPAADERASLSIIN
ncbi:MAG: site-specific integrase [Acidobacteria bacterium]|nr:site-specific integrase [Acidobacteriota bacterium]